MCDGCFWSQWTEREDDLTLDRYLAELGPEERAQIDRMYQFLDECSNGRFCTIDGLHAGVDNDNYDSPSWREEWNEAGDPKVAEACDLWDAMTDDARSIAVGLWHPYDALRVVLTEGHLPPEWAEYAKTGAVVFGVGPETFTKPFKDNELAIPAEPVYYQREDGTIGDLTEIPGYEPGKFLELTDGETSVGIAGHTGPDGDAPFAHTSVVARYPSGTDPLAAARDAMTVFMERTDGTNALAWWQQVRWWHGGPAGFKRGDRLLPPSETGRMPGLDVSDKESVYITSNRAFALSFAARHDRPMLYEVTGFPGEPLPDDLVPDESCARVPWCFVHRVEQPSTLELRRVLRELQATSTEETPPDVVT